MPESIPPYIAKPVENATQNMVPDNVLDSVQNSAAMPNPVEGLELRDIHLPDPVSWWPPAAGWWWLSLAIILCVVAIIVFCKYRHKKRHAAKTLARQQLLIIQQNFQQSDDKQQLAEDLSVLLRRASLSNFPRHDCAGLTGDAWLEFLDNVMPDKTERDRFKNGIGRKLIEAPYTKNIQYDADQLLSLCSDWIEALK